MSWLCSLTVALTAFFVQMCPFLDAFSPQIYKKKKKPSIYNVKILLKIGAFEKKCPMPVFSLKSPKTIVQNFASPRGSVFPCLFTSLFTPHAGNRNAARGDWKRRVREVETSHAGIGNVACGRISFLCFLCFLCDIKKHADGGRATARPYIADGT